MSYDITYMWNLKKDTNEPISTTERCTGIGNKLLATQRERRWGGRHNSQSTVYKHVNAYGAEQAATLSVL